MKNRKQVEEKIFKTLSLLEPGGLNAEKYKKMFKGMSDREFTNFFKRMKDDDNFNFYVEIDLYEKNNILLEDIQKAANYLKLPLEEYVFFTHKSEDGTPIRTKFRVPVFPIHMKRLQHILSKKVRLNTDVSGAGVRSKITGALNNSSKTGRLSDAKYLGVIKLL